MEDWIELGYVTAHSASSSDSYQVMICVRNIAGNYFYAAKLRDDFFAIARIKGTAIYNANARFCKNGENFYLEFQFPES